MMNEWDPSTEGTVRLTFFVGIFVLMAVWEILASRRESSPGKGGRWLGNLGLVLVDTIVLRLLFPAAAVGMAITAANHDIGLFHWLELPYWLNLVLSIAILDFALYVQHVIFHAIPALWQLHMVHHADVDVDVTTGIRFHPLEVVLSMVIKLGLVVALGPPILGVLIFEIVLNASSMFNHANIRIPRRLEPFLRWLIVTPDMHRVHHSAIKRENSSNFGFNLPWWDRLLGTYIAQPAEGHERMKLGLEDFRSPIWRRLPRLLVMPFSRRNRADSPDQD